jgi:hypothetical protein
MDYVITKKTTLSMLTLALSLTAIACSAGAGGEYGSNDANMVYREVVRDRTRPVQIFKYVGGSEGRTGGSVRVVSPRRESTSEPSVTERILTMVLDTTSDELDTSITTQVSGLSINTFIAAKSSNRTESASFLTYEGATVAPTFTNAVTFSSGSNNGELTNAGPEPIGGGYTPFNGNAQPLTSLATLTNVQPVDIQTCQNNPECLRLLGGIGLFARGRQEEDEDEDELNCTYEYVATTSGRNTYDCVYEDSAGNEVRRVEGCAVDSDELGGMSC